MSESEGLEKDLVVGTGQSSYRAIGEKEVLNMLKPLFKKHKLIIFPVDGEMKETNSTWEAENYGKKETKTRNVTQLKVKYKIVDIESNESETIVGFGNGADSQDKGSGKAFTYSFKTALSKTFMLFSGEDTDNQHSDDIGIPTQPLKDVSLISEEEIRKLFAIAGKDNTAIVKAVMASRGYKESKDIFKRDYDAICKELKAKLSRK